MVMFKILDKTFQNHFCPFQGFEIYLQEIFPQKSKEIQKVTNAYCDHLAKPYVNQGHFGSPKSPKTLSDQNKI